MGKLIGQPRRSDCASHCRGIYRSLDKGKCEITTDVLMFLQGCVHQSFFDLIGKDGFDIRNVTPDELYKEVISKLPEGWLCAEDNDEEEEDKVKKSL